MVAYVWLHLSTTCSFFTQKEQGEWQIALLYLQLGQAFNGLERPQDSEDPQGLDGINVLAGCPSVQSEGTVRLDNNPENHTKPFPP